MSSSACRSIRSLILVVLATASASRAQAEEWTWALTPYLWGAGVDLDVAVGNGNVIQAEADFSDLLDRLDFAAQLHFEGQAGKAGFFADAEFYDFNDDPQTYELGPFAPQVVAEGDLEMTLIELGALYAPEGGPGGFAFLLGMRIYDVSQDSTFEIGGPGNLGGTLSYDPTLYDALFGGRYTHRFANRWSIGGRADVAAGGTELTWNALAHGGYSFGKDERCTALLGYRHMQIDFDDEQTRFGATVEPELAMSGPFAGFRFEF